MANDSTFADWLIATGRAMGYSTYTALANAIGVPQPTVSRWKSGAKPSVEHLVKISELFGIELKTLLVLSGHMKGEVSPRDLQPPPSEAERVIGESPLEKRLKEKLLDFWEQRMQEEHQRLRELVRGVQHAVTPAGGVRPSELDPWMEKAMESALPWHVQTLNANLVAAEKPYTWFVFEHGGRLDVSNPRQAFQDTVYRGHEVEVSINHEGVNAGYYPFIACPEDGWAAATDDLETRAEAEAAVRHFFQLYPSLSYRKA